MVLKSDSKNKITPDNLGPHLYINGSFLYNLLSINDFKIDICVFVFTKLSKKDVRYRLRIVLRKDTRGVERNYLYINALATFRVAVFTTLISVNHLIVCDLHSTPKWNHLAIHFSTVRVCEEMFTPTLTRFLPSSNL